MDFDDNGFIASFGSAGLGGGGGTLPTGIIGIPNGSGWYTFYASLNLALASAVFGDTIVFFDDFVESTSGSTLVNGVDINLNGNSYILDTADTQNTLNYTSGAFTCSIYNGNIVRKNSLATGTTDGLVLNINPLLDSSLYLNNVEIIQESDACIISSSKTSINGGVFRGGSITQGSAGVTTSYFFDGTWYISQPIVFSFTRVYNSFFQNVNSTNVVELINSSELINSQIDHPNGGLSTSLDVGENCSIYGCIVFSNSIKSCNVNNAKVTSSTFRNILGLGLELLDSTAHDCSIFCVSGVGLILNSSEAHNIYCEVNLNNNPVEIGQGGKFYSSSIVQNKNDISACGIKITSNLGNITINKCSISLANSSGFAIDGVALSTATISEISADNSSGSLINTSNVTNLQTFTQDNFGNIIIG